MPLRFYKTSRGFDVFRGPERVDALAIEPAPGGGRAKGVVFKNIGGERVAAFASISRAQVELRRMFANEGE
jgi:hypothetical protein